MISNQKILPTKFMPFWWYQSPTHSPDFMTPESFFLFGNRDTGKSNTSMALGENYIFHGGQMIDCFGAENDSETLVYFLKNCPYRDRSIMITGSDVKVETQYPQISMDNFSFDAVKDYDVVTTDWALFGSSNSYYLGLSRLFEMAKMRRGWKETGRGKIVALVVREAWNIIYSQIRAEVSRDEQAAQMEIKKLNANLAHSGIALILDTQRYMDLNTNVRQLANYRIIKGFGGQVIPDEFDFLWREDVLGPDATKLRHMKPAEFIMVTSWNGVCWGMCQKVPWGIEKGKDIFKSLDIRVTKIRPKGLVEAKQLSRSPVALHNRMVELHNEGKTHPQIAKQITDEGHKLTEFTVRYHLQGRCGCSKQAGIGQ